MSLNLQTQHLEARYEAQALPVLRDFTLGIEPGVFVAVVGPNGSGKSSLIRALSRTLPPSSGAVVLGESDLYRQTSARDSACQIGVVPQDTSVAFDFTAREIVRMGRAPHLPRRPFAAETADDERIVQASLERAGVAELAERRVTSLSGGERQRVLLARTLAQQTEIILLDEPTASLDIRHQTETLSLMRSLAHDENKAVLAVLHDLNLAASFCDRLVLVHQGRIAAQGSPAEVLTASNIRAVYGARVWVRCHPTSGRPIVLSLPDAPNTPPLADGALLGKRILVICGGGTGAGLFLALRHAGYDVSSGGLNTGDTDQEAAEMLGIAYPSEAPFTALSDAVIAETRRLAAQADAILVTDVPFGPGNLANLQAALESRKAGTPVICFCPPDAPFAERDFTGGEAERLWNALLASGAIAVPDGQAAVAAIGQFAMGEVSE